MTKAELIERIIDCMIDPWTDDPEDYLYATPIDKYGAVDLMAQIREDEDSADLEPDERMPEEATPELVMEAYNCLIRARKHEARVNRLAEFITDENLVCEYANYYYPCHDDAIDIYPVDFLDVTNSPVQIVSGKDMSPLDLIELGKRSRNFNSAEEFCYYDKEKDQLVSTSNPFNDEIIDAEAFAEFILSDPDTFNYIFNDIMTDDDVRHVLGCTKEEYINE